MGRALDAACLTEVITLSDIFMVIQNEFLGEMSQKNMYQPRLSSRRSSVNPILLQSTYQYSGKSYSYGISPGVLFGERALFIGLCYISSPWPSVRPSTTAVSTFTLLRSPSLPPSFLPPLSLNSNGRRRLQRQWNFQFHLELNELSLSTSEEPKDRIGRKEAEMSKIK